MEEELRALLLETGAVSSVVFDRINWGEHPQGEPLPALVLHVVGNIPGLTLQGSDGLFSGRVQIDAYAHTFAEASRLARTVLNRLHGYSGGNFRGISVLSGPRSGREGGGNEASRPYRASQDFETHWRE